MTDQKHTAQDVVNFIKNEPVLRNPRYYREHHLDYVNAARRRKELGSWPAAVGAAGRDYEASLNHKPRRDGLTDQIILKRMDLERSVNARHMRVYYPGEFSANSPWEAYMKKLGKNYEHIKKSREITREDIIFDIISAEARNYDISPTGYVHYDCGYYQKALDLFSDHSQYSFIHNFDWALMASGINPESVRQRTSWSRARVMYDLREHVEQGHSSDWLIHNGFQSLRGAVDMYFGGFTKAVEAVKIFEEFGLFERLDEFKQVENYYTEISKLRSVSMDGRVRKKKDRSYIMNMDEPTKPITYRELHETLGKLEDFLSETDSLATASELRKATKIENSFLLAATPTRTIDCVLGKDLVPEMEARAEFGEKFRGPKTKIVLAAYYFLRKREWGLKNKWAKEFLR